LSGITLKKQEGIKMKEDTITRIGKWQRICIWVAFLLFAAAIYLFLFTSCVTIKIYPVSKTDTVTKLTEVEQYQYLDVKN
jgi:hypothetical protein